MSRRGVQVVYQRRTMSEDPRDKGEREKRGLEMIKDKKGACQLPRGIDGPGPGEEAVSYRRARTTTRKKAEVLVAHERGASFNPFAHPPQPARCGMHLKTSRHGALIQPGESTGNCLDDNPGIPRRSHSMSAEFGPYGSLFEKRAVPGFGLQWGHITSGVAVLVQSWRPS